MKTMGTKMAGMLPSVLLVCWSLFIGAPVQAIDVWNYWLGPHGLVAEVENLTWSGQTIPGRHVFWRGSKWGRTVALQGGPSMTRYDIFVENGTVLEYWGTFRGNDVSDDDSHSFDSPFRWMNSSMNVGEVVEHAVPLQVLDSQQRRPISSGSPTMRLEINAHYPSWILPETGAVYQDVLKITFYSDKSNPASKEVYHLARGKGWIRFESASSSFYYIKTAWAVSFSNSTVSSPTSPWFDPLATVLGTKSGVFNGLFEYRTSSANGARINDHLPYWTATSGDGVITTDAPPLGGSGPWQICLIGLTGGIGDGVADAASSAWIPVVGGRSYKLSGWLWRVSASDNVYLDFNDGVGLYGSFPDAHATSTSTGRWEFKEATVTVPSTVSYIKVRAVRDGANQGNAYFDRITVQRIN